MSSPARSKSINEELFSEGGEMGAMMRALDWSLTPLGPAELWPQSLKTSVSICLNSRFAILIWWGPQLVKLYNDAYRPLIGDKHPWALGAAGREVWPEIWDTIGPMLSGVMERGEASWSDDLLLLLERNGYPEECYFTFSYSPIRDESGGVGGVFTPVTETTERVIGERRLRTLRDLAAAHATESKNAEQACVAGAQALSVNSYDLPFAAIYLFDSEGKSANFVSDAEFNTRGGVFPARVELAHETWLQCSRLLKGETLTIDLDAAGFPPLPRGDWGIPTHEAIAVPIRPSMTDRPLGFLLAGISPRKRLGQDYRSFYSAISDQLARTIIDARAVEREIARAKSLAEMRRQGAEREAGLRAIADAERKKLIDLFMFAPAAIVTLSGPEHRVTLANEHYLKLIGRKSDDLMGKTIREALPEIEGQGFFELLDRVYQTGVPFVGNEMQAHLGLKNIAQLGEVYCNFVYQPTFDAAGKIDGILAHIVDVTEQKRVQASQAAERRVLELIATGRPLLEVLNTLARETEEQSKEGMLFSVLLTDEGGERLLHGAAPSLPEAYNRRIHGLRIGPCVGSCGTAAFEQQPVFVYDIAADPLWVDFKDLAATYGLGACCSTPIFSSRGQLLGTIAMYYRHPHNPGARERELIERATQLASIAIERKQAEEAVRTAAERLRFMMESMPQKVFTATSTGEVDYFNRQWMEFTGLSFEQIRDWGWTQFIHPDDVAENVRIWRHSIETGEAFIFEHRFRRADGSYRWHLSRAAAMRDSGGKIVMWIGSNTDIHDQKQSEIALRESEKLAVVGRLASTIAHEINNPLESVTNLLYLMRSNTSLDDLHYNAQLAEQELARVSHVVTQTLSFHRHSTVATSEKLSTLLNSAVGVYQGRLTTSGTVLRRDYRDVEPISCFPAELRQVFANLIGNAFDATRTGGKIVLRTTEATDWRSGRCGVRVTIADTGHGMDSKTLKRIFEPFFTTKGNNGTGLGLWVSADILKKHRARIRVRSRQFGDATGTTFSMFFPRQS